MYICLIFSLIYNCLCFSVINGQVCALTPNSGNNVDFSLDSPLVVGADLTMNCNWTIVLANCIHDIYIEFNTTKRIALYQIRPSIQPVQHSRDSPWKNRIQLTANFSVEDKMGKATFVLKNFTEGLQNHQYCCVLYTSTFNKQSCVSLVIPTTTKSTSTTDKNNPTESTSSSTTNKDNPPATPNPGESCEGDCSPGNIHIGSFTCVTIATILLVLIT